MSESKDEMVVVAGRVSAVPHPPAGSIVDFCTTCDEAVWLEPRSVALISSGTASGPLCLPCGTAAGAFG